LGVQARTVDPPDQRIGSVEGRFMRICGNIQGQFPNYQIHFVKQGFGSPGKLVSSAGHTKLPSLLRKSAPDRCRDER
jgi:hypothetical protein